MSFTDQRGKEIPDEGHVARTFADVELIKTCLDGIRNYSAIIERLVHARSGSAQRYCDTIRASLPRLHNYIDEVQTTFPYAVCDVCNGRDGGCSDCNGRGYLNFHDYALHQSEKLVLRRNEDGSKKNARDATRKIVRAINRLNWIENGQDEDS